MLKGDKIFALMLAVLLFLAGLTVYHNYQLDKNLRPTRPRIDPQILAEQLESGNLSLQKADFFHVLGKPEGESSADGVSNQNPKDN